MNSERIIEEIEAAWVQYKESEYGASLKICNIVMDELKHLAVLINGSNSEKLTFFQIYSLMLCTSLNHYHLKEYELSRENLSYCKQYQPSRSIAYVYSGLILILDGDINGALEELSYAIFKDPSNHQDALCVRAAIYHHQGKMNNAFIDSSTVLQQNPENVMALIIKGDSLKYDLAFAEGGLNSRPVKTIRNEELIYYQQALELDSVHASSFIGKGFQGSDIIDYIKIYKLTNEEKPKGTQWWHHLNKMLQTYSVDVPKYYSLRGESKTDQDNTKALSVFAKMFAPKNPQIMIMPVSDAVMINTPSPHEILVLKKEALLSSRTRQVQLSPKQVLNPNGTNNSGSSDSANQKKQPNYERAWRDIKKRRKRTKTKIIMFHDLNIKAPERNYSKPWLEDSYKNRKPTTSKPERIEAKVSYLKRGSGHNIATCTKSNQIANSTENTNLSSTKKSVASKRAEKLTSLPSSTDAIKAKSSSFSSNTASSLSSNKESILPSFRRTASRDWKANSPAPSLNEKKWRSTSRQPNNSLELTRRSHSYKPHVVRPSTAPTGEVTKKNGSTQVKRSSSQRNLSKEKRIPSVPIRSRNSGQSKKIEETVKRVR